jgi:pimeloyl-ACP methyl ester carboxylesterase
MQGIDAPIVHQTLRSGDGTRIAYYVVGRGPRPWVLAPGLGTNLYCWKYLFEEYQDRYTIFTWDPRGTYRSDPPAIEARVRVEDHVDDLDAIVAAEGLDRFVLGGWSMGVQISLESYHRNPERPTALVLINGAYQHLLETALDLPGAGLVFPGLIRSLGRASPLLRPVLREILRWRGAPRLLTALGFLQGNHEAFAPVLREFSDMDWGVYARLMLALNEHSAAAYLRDVRVPTLVTAGTRDLMTPIRTAEDLHRGIAGSELYVVPRGTHYTLTEFPVELHRGITAFLRRADPAAFAPPPPPPAKPAAKSAKAPVPPAATPRPRGGRRA